MLLQKQQNGVRCLLEVNIKNYRIPDQNVYNGIILYINFVDKYVEDHFISLATTRYNAIPI